MKELIHNSSFDTNFTPISHGDRAKFARAFYRNFGIEDQYENDSDIRRKAIVAVHETIGVLSRVEAEKQEESVKAEDRVEERSHEENIIIQRSWFEDNSSFSPEKREYKKLELAAALRGVLQEGEQDKMGLGGADKKAPKQTLQPAAPDIRAKFGKGPVDIDGDSYRASFFNRKKKPSVEDETPVSSSYAGGASSGREQTNGDNDDTISLKRDSAVQQVKGAIQKRIWEVSSEDKDNAGEDILYLTSPDKDLNYLEKATFLGKGISIPNYTEELRQVLGYKISTRVVAGVEKETGRLYVRASSNHERERKENGHYDIIKLIYLLGSQAYLHGQASSYFPAGSKQLLGLPEDFNEYEARDAILTSQYSVPLHLVRNGNSVDVLEFPLLLDWGNVGTNGSVHPNMRRMIEILARNKHTGGVDDGLTTYVEIHTHKMIGPKTFHHIL